MLQSFHSRKCTWKCLWNGSHFVLASMCLGLILHLFPIAGRSLYSGVNLRAFAVRTCSDAEWEYFLPPGVNTWHLFWQHSRWGFIACRRQTSQQTWLKKGQTLARRITISILFVNMTDNNQRWHLTIKITLIECNERVTENWPKTYIFKINLLIWI